MVTEREVREELLGSMKGRGTANRWLCRFFTWFWFSRDNRTSHWPQKVVYVFSPRHLRVDQGSSRKHVWLQDGYEYPRAIFIAIGEFLRRYRWFLHWNRPRCPKCDHDTFKVRYRDMIDYYYGPVCEEIQCCVKCGEDVSQFMYGNYETGYTTRWGYYEEILFGRVGEDSR